MQNDISQTVVIYEDDDLIVYHDRRNSSYVLVSFAHMDFKPDNGPYWGSKPLGKLDVSAIGIVAKRNVWYPPALMEDAIKSISKITAQYAEVVSYGFSMGAYGALKYSKALNATTVIALSPQASLDPNDDVRCSFRTFFKKDLHVGSGIRSGDISGSVYVVYDPYMKDDSWSAKFIAGSYASARLIIAPWAQHETIDLFASTSSLRSLLDYCRSGDDKSLVRLVGLRRRNTWRRLEAVASYAISRNRTKGWGLAMRHSERLGGWVMGRLVEKHGSPTGSNEAA